MNNCPQRSPIDRNKLHATWLAAFVLTVTAMIAPCREVAAQSSDSIAASTPDDGWRYTNRGWEHVSSWKSLEIVDDRVGLADSQTTLLERVAGLLLIVGGCLGLLWLMTIEIDPIEQRAFRVRVERSMTFRKVATPGERITPAVAPLPHAELPSLD